MGVYAIKPRFQRLLKPVADVLIALRVHPDAINAAGLVIALAMAAALYLVDRWPALYWVLPLGAFLRTACNALDGMVARGLEVSSALGEVQNELFDRVSDAAIFLSLGLSGHCDLAVAAVGTAAILINSYLGILGKAAGGKRVYTGILGKADRMILVGVMGIVSFFHPAGLAWEIVGVVVVSATLVSALQRVWAIREDLR